MVLVQNGAQVGPWAEPAFVNAVFTRQLPPETPVSFDGGRSWIAAMALLGLRNLRRDPTTRGKGRAVFALVVAAVLALPNLLGLVVTLGRALFG